jgi:protein required for attachment to host cells
MTTTLVVVADRTHARFLVHAGPGKDLEPSGTMDNPAGRKLDQEIDSDRPGRVHDRHGGAPHALEREEPPHERAARDFARGVAAHVERARNDGRFNDLVLVAEPRFLGMLREALDPVSAKHIRGTVGKDLVHTEIRDLPPHLGSVLPIS